MCGGAAERALMLERGMNKRSTSPLGFPSFFHEKGNLEELQNEKRYSGLVVPTSPTFHCAIEMPTCPTFHCAMKVHENDAKYSLKHSHVQLAWERVRYKGSKRVGAGNWPV